MVGHVLALDICLEQCKLLILMADATVTQLMMDVLDLVWVVERYRRLCVMPRLNRLFVVLKVIMVIATTIVLFHIARSR